MYTFASETSLTFVENWAITDIYPGTRKTSPLKPLLDPQRRDPLVSEQILVTDSDDKVKMSGWACNRVCMELATTDCPFML
jgi:hypothetical protein